MIFESTRDAMAVVITIICVCLLLTTAAGCQRETEKAKAAVTLAAMEKGYEIIHDRHGNVIQLKPPTNMRLEQP